MKKELLNALGTEISITTPLNNDEIIDTVYFGGGTPSILSAAELAGILQSIRDKFRLAPDVEITIEANPDDINNPILAEWQNMGVNRLSLGIQSFDDEELRWMNRAHNAAQSVQSINDIISAGFTNFSVDLIYGSPLLNNDALKKNAEIIFSKQIPHISAYALTVEAKTALYKMIEKHDSPAIDTNRQAEQFEMLLQLTEDAGYEQYEISNFAQPGYRSKHNSSYWRGKPYYGFGPAAHSFNGKNIRRWNIANNALYIQSLQKNEIPFEEEILTPVQQMNEYIMTSLRTIEGLNLEIVNKKHGAEEVKKILAQSKKYLDQKLMRQENGFIILNKEGKFLADGIAADLFF